MGHSRGDTLQSCSKFSIIDATGNHIKLCSQIKEIPKEMRAKLPQSYHSALEIRAPLKQANLHKTVLELMEFFHLQFEMVFPPLNYPLLLFKHVRDLGLPGKHKIQCSALTSNNNS